MEKTTLTILKNSLTLKEQVAQVNQAIERGDKENAKAGLDRLTQMANWFVHRLLTADAAVTVSPFSPNFTEHIYCDKGVFESENIT